MREEINSHSNESRLEISIEIGVNSDEYVSGISLPYMAVVILLSYLYPA